MKKMWAQSGPSTCFSSPCRNPILPFSKMITGGSRRHAVAGLTGTYLSEIELTPEQLRKTLEKARQGSRSTHVLFACAAHYAACRKLIDYASLNDWLWSVAYTLRHPQRMYEVMR